MKSWTTSNGTEIIRILSGRSNVFVVRNQHFSLIADTSVRFDRRRLYRRILHLLGPKGPDLVVLTHTHVDHAGNAAFLKGKFAMPIAVHRSEAGFLQDGFSPLPAVVKGPLKWLQRLDENRIRLFIHTEPVAADILVDDVLDLNNHGIPVMVRHMPGHTNGSMTVIIDQELAIVGDNMVNMTWQRVFPPFCDNVPALLQSWKALLDSHCRLFLPSHGSQITREALERAYAGIP